MALQRRAEETKWQGRRWAAGCPSLTQPRLCLSPAARTTAHLFLVHPFSGMFHLSWEPGGEERCSGYKKLVVVETEVSGMPSNTPAGGTVEMVHRAVGQEVPGRQDQLYHSPLAPHSSHTLHPRAWREANTCWPTAPWGPTLTGQP